MELPVRGRRVLEGDESSDEEGLQDAARAVTSAKRLESAFGKGERQKQKASHMPAIDARFVSAKKRRT